MNKEEFIRKHSDSYSKFIASEFATDLIECLFSMRQKAVLTDREHISVQLLSVIKGYEDCLNNLNNLLKLREQQKVLQANYGVEDNDKTK